VTSSWILFFSYFCLVSRTAIFVSLSDELTAVIQLFR